MNAVGIVPAAGASRRMGQEKLLLPWGETVLAGAVVEALRAGGAETVVLVAAAANTSLQRWARTAGCAVALNRDPGRGMLSSVWEGLESLGGAERLSEAGTAVLVCPGDLPGIEPQTVAALLEQLRTGAQIVVPVSGQRRGHPLAIGPSLVGEIPALDPAVGLRQILEDHAHRLVRLPVESTGSFRDLDTPDDYREALAEGKGDAKRRHR